MRGEPLGPRTTLGLGGRAEFFCEVKDTAALVAALDHARAAFMPVTVLAGGSNVVVADAGVSGLTIALALRGLDFFSSSTGQVHVRAAAGEALDDLVLACVERDLSGLECLSGVPGSVGATPIQNVGAYGAEVADCIVGVDVIDRQDGAALTMSRDECRFGYRDSRFRREPGRYVVTAVTFALVSGGRPQLRYGELSKVLSSNAAKDLMEVRAAVLALRRSKSMVLDASDPNGRSAGSFFKNPVLDDGAFARLKERAVSAGLIADEAQLPAYPDGAGATKVAAGFLIEQAGFAKGTRRGPVGLSTRHALCLVHHGGGRTSELLALAREIQDGVLARFGVSLHPEPVFLGFPSPPLPGAMLG